MARRVHKNHYVAPSPVNTESPTPVHISRGGMANRGYSTDGEESQRAPSERTMSEYTTVVRTSTISGNKLVSTCNVLTVINN